MAGRGGADPSGTIDASRWTILTDSRTRFEAKGPGRSEAGGANRLSMWISHWNLSFDPFRPGAVPYVETPPHEEAVARLVHRIESGDRRISLRAEAGLGKSTVWAEVARRLRSPSRRIISIRQPADGGALLRGLLDSLAGRDPRDRERSVALGRLLDACRLARARGLGLVIGVDGDGLLDQAEDLRLLDRIEAIGAQSGARFSLIVAGRGPRTEADPWTLAVRLRRLSRFEAAAYLAAKLLAAGREDPVFSDRAVSRWHAIARGCPLALDRLAGLALRAGALERREILSTEVVEGVARQCEGLADPVDPVPADPLR